jgi:LysM repeat protein
MKYQTLAVKRRPVSRGLFRRLNAVTRNRRQRVAATAGVGNITEDDGSSGISRALTIIFLFHIVAIALIFVHQRFMDGRGPAASTAVRTGPPDVAAPADPQRGEVSHASSGGKPYIVRAGDNYAAIAAAEGVDESDLRQANRNVEIGPGLILRIPPKRVVTAAAPEVAAIRLQPAGDSGHGLVKAKPVETSGAPRAVVVRQDPVPSAAGGATYVVRPGDSLYRIAMKHKVSQEALQSANGIADPNKLKVGEKLVIPRDPR